MAGFDMGTRKGKVLFFLLFPWLLRLYWLALEYATQFHFFFNYLVKLFGKGNLVYRGSCVLRSYVWSTILNSGNSFWRSPKIFGIERVKVTEVVLAAMKLILFYTCSQIELLLFM